MDTKNMEATTPTQRLYGEFTTFIYYWDSFTVEEREKLNNDFQKRLYELQ